jgi:monoamine oxidase
MIGTDTVAERIWNTSPGQPGPERMLHAYLLDGNADTFASVPHHERTNRIRSEISRFLPGLDSQIVTSYAKVWHKDPSPVEPSRLHSSTNYNGSSQPPAAPITDCTSPANIPR